MRASARDLARRALRRIEVDHVFATMAVGDELSRLALEPRDRRLVTEIVNGVMRHRSRLDRALVAASARGLQITLPMRIILRVAAYQHLFLDRVPSHAIVSDAVDAATALGGKRMGGFANGVLRKLIEVGEPELPPRSVPYDYAEVSASIPAWLVKEIAAGVGQQHLAEAADAFSTVPALGIRAQLARTTREELAASLSADAGGGKLVSSPLVPGGLIGTGLGAPDDLDSFRAGLWTVQDVAAQLISHLAAPGENMQILDACAGVGGKTAHLAELAPTAQITAVDLSEAKLERLRETCARLGVAARVDTVASDLLAYAAQTDKTFDLIVLDAPCTGLGVVRRHPEAKWRVHPEDVARQAGLQASLLDAVAPRVGVGGALVYSICSFTRAEGERQVAAFLARQTSFALVSPMEDPAASPDIPWAQLVTPSGAIGTWPHLHEADGFFAARLVRVR